MDSEIDLREKATSTTLANSLAIRLRASIMQGEIAPGERLNLGELKERFGISFSPLREALTRLAAEGLVVAQGQRGFHVAPVSAENLDELIRLRCMAESLALRESIRLGDDRWEESLVAAHYRLSRVQPDRSDPVADQIWESAHRAYHLALVSACHMPLLLKFCNTLHDLSDRYRRLFLMQAPRDKQVPDEHLQMYEAALARDADKATSILEAHIRRIGVNTQLAITQLKPQGGNAVGGRATPKRG